MDLVGISEELLLAFRLGNETDELISQLKGYNIKQLAEYLPNDDYKKAFWLNIYNAHILKAIRNKDDDNQFYTKKIIHFHRVSLSFDDVEHGILRRSKLKWSLGYLNKWKVDDWEKQLRVGKLDFRIHFALNCGANSCPPITSYNAEQVNSQLCNNTKNYLMDGSVFSTTSSNRIKVPRLFRWYFADFGGFKGIKKLYRKYNLVPIDSKAKISFLSYDWTINTENFTTEIN